MEKINVLFSSVGRRVELVRAFRKAQEEMNIRGNLVGCDIDKLAPALEFTDKEYIVPRVLEEGFIESIIKICNKEDIHLIIPTIDTELKIYANNKELIETKTSAKIMISDKKAIDIVRNKVETYKFLKAKGIGVPRLIEKGDIEGGNYEFPLFIKPLDGSSSIDAFKIKNDKELFFFNDYIHNPIIQEFADGPEYCVDVFSDFDSNVITVVPKLRLAHRSGEITKSEIVKDREIIELAKKIVEVLGAKGEINFDCIRTENGLKVIEINGRFAGGAPIAFRCGANSPKNLFKILLGEKVEYNEDYKEGMIALRFDDAIFLEGRDKK